LTVSDYIKAPAALQTATQFELDAADQRSHLEPLRRRGYRRLRPTARMTRAQRHASLCGVKIKQKLKPQGPATAIILTDAQVDELGGGKRAPVTVTIGAKTVRLRLAVMGGQNMIGISKANRGELGVEIGDTVDATIKLDVAERKVEVPDDAAKALAKAKLRKQFDALAFTHQKEHVNAILEAKKPETRAKRIDAMLAKLRG
jgi:hypothetical protein